LRDNIRHGSSEQRDIDMREGSIVIINYPIATYPNSPAPVGHMPFADLLVRSDR
jgi:hypothetical protein